MTKFVQKIGKICKYCDNKFWPISNRQKMCSQQCSTDFERKDALRRYHEKKNGTFTSTMTYSGIGLYKKIMENVKSCTKCGSTQFLVVHHKDENRQNNDISNLEKLCKRCHQIEHDCQKNLLSPEELGKMRSEFIKKNEGTIRDEQGRFIRKV